MRETSKSGGADCSAEGRLAWRPSYPHPSQRGQPWRSVFLLKKDHGHRKAVEARQGEDLATPFGDLVGMLDVTFYDILQGFSSLFVIIAVGIVAAQVYNYRANQIELLLVVHVEVVFCIETVSFGNQS